MSEASEPVEGISVHRLIKGGAQSAGDVSQQSMCTNVVRGNLGGPAGAPLMVTLFFGLSIGA
jgi:hypothetical protein